MKRKNVWGRLFDLECDSDRVLKYNDELSARITKLECAVQGHGIIETRSHTVEANPHSVCHGIYFGEQGGSGTLITKICTKCGMQVDQKFVLDKTARLKK